MNPNASKQPLTHLTTVRTDPATGRSYEFSIHMPDNIGEIHEGNINQPKKYTLILLWKAINNYWGIDDFPGFYEELMRVLPIFDSIVKEVAFYAKDAEPSTGSPTGADVSLFEYTYSLGVDESLPNAPWYTDETKPDVDFIKKLWQEVSNSAGIHLAIGSYINVFWKSLEATVLKQRKTHKRTKKGDPNLINVKEVEDEEVKSTPPESELDLSVKRLFPNSKNLDLSKEFGISKPHTDSWVRIMKDVNWESAIAQYENSGENSRSRKPVFKSPASDVELTLSSEYMAKAIAEETKRAKEAEVAVITHAEIFGKELLKVRDAKVLQTFVALSKWANLQDSAVFVDVPISEIMSLILKSSGNCKFNTEQRREFSRILEYLASISITVRIMSEQVNPKTKKAKPILRVERGVKLLRLVATYSVKKEFLSLPKELLRADMHFDETVINKISGELFPGNDNLNLFTQRANVYQDSLLEFDAHKDSKAIVMGFQIQTRFNQIKDKEKFIDVDRAFLIDLCDYEKTNRTMPSQATKQITNNLEKLKKVGIISSYTSVTNKDLDRIKIYPPKQNVLT